MAEHARLKSNESHLFLSHDLNVFLDVCTTRTMYFCDLWNVLGPGVRHPLWIKIL